MKLLAFLPKIGFKESILIVFISTIIFNFNVMWIFGSLIFSSLQLFFITVLVSLSSSFFNLIGWWIGIVMLDYSAVRLFKLKSSYDSLVPAIAVIYGIGMILYTIFIILFSFSEIFLFVIPISLTIILNLSVIKEIYNTNWKKAVLIPLGATIVTGAFVIAGLVIGIIIGYGIGSLI